MPANEPYRRFDENGNWQPPPARAGFYKQNPQFANARLQNPKGHPDGPRTAAGEALAKWEQNEKAQGRGRYNKWTYDPVTQTKLQTGKYRKGDNPYKGITAQERVAAGEKPHRVSYPIGADKPTIDSSQSDFMARGPGPAMAAENATRSNYAQISVDGYPSPGGGYNPSDGGYKPRSSPGGTNQYGDPSDTVYAGGSPSFNESTGRYEDYTGADGTVTRGRYSGRNARRNRRRKPGKPTRMAGDILDKNFQPGQPQGNDVVDLRGTDNPVNTNKSNFHLNSIMQDYYSQFR